LANIVYYQEITSPVGPLVIACSTAGLCRIEFGTFLETKEKLIRWSLRYYGTAIWELSDLPSSVAEQLDSYFKGQTNHFDIIIDLQGTEFQKKVWRALLQIPYGVTNSYKEVGRKIHAERAVRAVGGANNRNPIPIIIPCHRVIGASGSLIGYGGGLDKKQLLLDLEAN
jgi:O-6-methylguanine DNA methyltransferase